MVACRAQGRKGWCPLPWRQAVTGLYSDRYTKTDQGWRIAHTGYKRVFEEHRVHSTLAVLSFTSRFGT